MDQIGQQTISNRPATNYERAKAYRQRKISFQSLLKDIFLMMIGISSAAFALKSFLLPSNFIDGGATGIALLLGEITDFQFPVLLLLVNAPFVFFWISHIGTYFFY